MRAARDAAEDATLIRQEAEKRHTAAQVAAEQARRQGLFDSAKAEADAAADALARAYPKLVASMISMLGDLARAQQAVALANKQLPDGVAPLVDPEVAARSVSSQPREMVADEEVQLWARLDQPVPVDAAFQGKIYDCGGGWGKRVDDMQPAFRKRRFRKISYREPVNGEFPLPLATALQLPSVRGSGMLWGEANPVLNPGLSAALMGQGTPEAVLGRLAVDAAAAARAIKVERPIKVEWHSHTDVVPLPERPFDSNDTTSRRSDARPSGSGVFASAVGGRK